MVKTQKNLNNPPVCPLKAKSKAVNPQFYESIPTSFIEDIHLKEKICAVIGPVTEDEAVELGLKKLRLYK